jgi:hypothetical protein
MVKLIGAAAPGEPFIGIAENESRTREYRVLSVFSSVAPGGGAF